jgi:tRNA threonylcarbamoyladenosine biosynthesis protein TsaB
MILLHIETTTNVCSVAISKNDECIYEATNFEGMNHAALLSTFIEDGLKLTAIEKPDAVVVSGGPGSYTGLRVGVSTAKGLCFGWNIPLIAIDTLLIMAVEASKTNENNALLCPMIDARRMEVYTALYDVNLKELLANSAQLIDENSFLNVLTNNEIVFFGNGAEKCKAIINHNNAKFTVGIQPLAINMIKPGIEAFNNQRFVDLAYYEPNYVKEFYTTAKMLF